MGPYFLYEGTPLICTKNQPPILNGVWYELQSIDSEVHLIDDQSCAVSLPLEKAKSCLALRHAMTVHKAQSRTIEGHVRIVPGRGPGQVSHHWTLNHLLVGASRATALPNLSIE